MAATEVTTEIAPTNIATSSGTYGLVTAIMTLIATTGLDSPANRRRSIWVANHFLVAAGRANTSNLRFTAEPDN
jgi:hypothetical protein